MIVISSSLVTAAAADASIDLKAPVFGYRSEVTTATIATTDAATGYPASNLANVSTASLWKALDASGTKYITITPSVASPFDYVAIARHNFGSAQIAVTVEARVSAPDAWAVIVAEFMPTTNDALILRFTRTTYHSVRIKLAAGSAPAQASVVYAGLLLVMQRRVYVGHTPITMGRQTNIATGVSEGGNFLGRVITGGTLRSGLSFQNLTPAWVRSDLDPFIQAARSKPFFFGWRPQDYPFETAFCWAPSDIRPVNSRSNGMMSVEFEIEGAAA
jgi:hypothetical protein